MAMRQANIKCGRTYMNWPDTATRTVTAIVVYFDEVRRDWRPPKGRCGLNQFRGWAKKEVGAALPEHRIRPLPER